MACSLLNIDYNTKHAVFSIDSESDIGDLPKINLSGKGMLNTIGSVSQGSKAIGTNGINYILTGNNEWIRYNSTVSESDIEDYNIATESDIDSLFT